MCNNRLLLVLLCLCQIGIAQTSDFNCEIHISPRDSVIYSNEVQNIELSVDNVPNFLINWHGDSLDLADSLHPVATIPINQTRTYYLEAIYQNDSNLIVNGDFESGNTGFNTDLSYAANVGGCALCAEGKYAVGTNPHNYHPSWVDTTREGNMLIVNGATVPGMIVYNTSINVQPNTEYVVKFEGANIDRLAGQSNVARLQFSVNGQQLGDIFPLSTGLFIWSQYYQTWTSGDSTTANITILNQNSTGGGNDFAIDNIEVYEICYAYDTITLQTIASNYDTITQTLCEGQSYQFADSIFTQTTIYNDTTSNEDNMNSTITTLNLTVNPSQTIILKDTICNGESYDFFDELITQSGQYTRVMQNQYGCDSTIILQLEVLPEYESLIEAKICNGETYIDDNFNENTQGTYTITLLSTYGCDSTITLQLEVLPEYESLIEAKICNGETYIDDNFNENTQGTYTKTLTSIYGCDSTIILQLEVLPEYESLIEAKICNGETYIDNNFNESTQGIYTATLSSTYGCDSVVTLKLNVKPTYDTIINITQNDATPYEENGFYADSSGVYVQELISSEGCDSIVTLNFAIRNLEEIFVPNAFMPTYSGDENISRFHIYTDNKDIEISHFIIFDRWGTKVFETDDITLSWDGLYKGKLSPEGVYEYIFLYFDKKHPDYVKEKSGEFMLIY